MTNLRLPELQPHIERVIGHLNFASGPLEPGFFMSLDRVIAGVLPVSDTLSVPLMPSGKPKKAGARKTKARVEAAETQETASSGGSPIPVGEGVSDRPPAPLSHPRLLAARDLLLESIQVLSKESPAFADCSNAEARIRFVVDQLLPAYRDFHRDLLFHLTDESIFQPFLVGRCFEAAIVVQTASESDEAWIADSLQHLNDYVGYRPVPMLVNTQCSVYPHERFRPVPVYIKGAGVASGPYHGIVKKCLEILSQTDPDTLQAACFDPDHLEELAIDIRAYDFDHPVNKRPNYHFGQWDPDHISPQGYYSRFIIHQMMLEGLMRRGEISPEIPADECEFELAGTLAGTMLMGAGVSGDRPDCHDSTVTLSSLMPIIANYRDDFYDRLLESVHGPHRERLESELSERRQPFGGVRQHLNAELAARRATQVQHVQLAKIYAKMGYEEAAAKQAAIVPVTSARIVCRIDCLLSSATDACLQRRLEECLRDLREVRALINRGIDCGAIVDPWSLLGFDGNFPLFPAVENSVPDHRADDLVGIVEQTLDIFSHLLAEAAAAVNQPLFTEVKADFTSLVEWWRQYAPHEISALQAVDAAKILAAAEHVADALRLWRAAGSAAGDVAFWGEHAEIFRSPKAYQLVIDALLERKDSIASQALLIHWLSQAPYVGLVQGETSYHELVLAWIGLQQKKYGEAENFDEREAIWQQVRKFYDFLEANADEYWQVPEFEIPADGIETPVDKRPLSFRDEPEYDRDDRDSADSFDGDSYADGYDEDYDEEDDEEQDEPDGMNFDAAYEDVVYMDSTDDGVEGNIYESDTSKQDGLESEGDRLIDRLSFLNTLAILWSETAHLPLPVTSIEQLSSTQVEKLRLRTEVLDNWIRQASEYQEGLSKLLKQVLALRLPKGNGELSGLMEYDRFRLVKEALMERIASANVEMQMAAVGLRAVRHGLCALLKDCEFGKVDSGDPDANWVILFAGILARNVQWVDAHLDTLLQSLEDLPLLYVPLGRGGQPDDLVRTRVRQQCFQRALASLPMMGMFAGTVNLLRVARSMERRNNVGLGAITEYDEMFRGGFCSMVQALIVAAKPTLDKKTKKARENAELRLFSQLEQLTESMLSAWLLHSRTLRLSVLEKLHDNESWDQLVRFIKRYGGQLFTQEFLNLGNIRAVLHQGVETWLQQLHESNQELDLELLNDLDHDLSLSDAARHLSVVLEAVLENYSEYRDYNSTTTQSDRGDLIYTFLDFLRLRSKYDRVAWHLKPVVWAHQMLVRAQVTNVAGRWRRQLGERVEAEAFRYEDELKKLQVKYSMRMPTVADRLSERFVQPLQIDRLCALVEPAIHLPDREAAKAAFDLLELEANSLTRRPMGVGLEIPAWLILLEQEVDLQRTHEPGSALPVPGCLIDPLPLTVEEVEEALDALLES